MPCPECPEEKKISDLELCRIWRAVGEVNQARSHFQRHLDFLSCQRCREIAVDILSLLDIYGRMLSNAENYKLERARLIERFHKILEKLDPEASKKEENLE